MPARSVSRSTHTEWPVFKVILVLSSWLNETINVWMFMHLLGFMLFFDLTLVHLGQYFTKAVRRDNKQRFSLLEEDGELLIRANQGHTVICYLSNSGQLPYKWSVEIDFCCSRTDAEGWGNLPNICFIFFFLRWFPNKTSLRMAVARIKLLRNRKEVQVHQMRHEVAQLLEANQDMTARIRVEHVIREEKFMQAYDLIEVYYELIVARLSIIDSQK
ncbi:Regulator of Vps4 activity in the MVB pathway protein [Zea mays]|uniref:Regulator of Vps4 activity in the MVB pathway protein n=1 Tax=Zea mays TaxID=4577 RepID=A0A1D6LHQ3_MAIZE|nr:Regulator of Vps4 activity in the MVB pathway protein [Zea mays]